MQTPRFKPRPQPQTRAHFSRALTFFSCRGCAYGGAEGAIYTYLLPQHEAAFGESNPKRCITSMLPFCACSRPAPPPPAIQPPPPPGITGDWDAVPAPVAADRREA